MIREAELFLMAERELLGVLGRLRDHDWRVMLPPLLDVPGADEKVPVRRAVERYAREEAWIPDLLAGRTVDEVGADRFDGDLLSPAPVDALRRLSDTACGAASQVADGGASVQPPTGEVTAAEYLLGLALVRAIVAHEIAVHVGTVCPLTEELSQALWEATQTADADAAAWRARGIFRDPILPLPPDVSRRDRFLQLAGRDPHPMWDRAGH